MHSRPVLALAVAAALLAGCQQPTVDPDEPTPDADAPADESTPDPDAAAFDEAVDQAVAPLTEAAGEIERAAGLTDLDDARALAGRTARMLVDSPILVANLPGDAPDVLPYLPAETGGESVLSQALGMARRAGDHGARLVSVLNDPVVGDTTTWQRAAEDRIQRIHEAVREGTEEAVSGLDGQVPQATAWAILAAQATGTDQLRERADRASAHLAVALAALEDARH